MKPDAAFPFWSHNYEISRATNLNSDERAMTRNAFEAGFSTGYAWTEGHDDRIAKLEVERDALKAENEGLSVQLYEATEDLAGCQSACAVIDKRFLDAQAEVKRLRDALVLAVAVFDDAKGQWGSEYLWTKFGLDEAMKPAREALAALEGGGNGE